MKLPYSNDPDSDASARLPAFPDETERFPIVSHGTRTASGLRRRVITNPARHQRTTDEVHRILAEVAAEWALVNSVPLPMPRRRRWWPGRG